MMQAMSVNQHTFKVNFKSIAAEHERIIQPDMADSALNFDPKNPEGKYCLELKEPYNQICLQNLLKSAEKAAEKSEGKFEIKQCFF